MATQKFYLCEHCKNLIGMVDNMGVPVECCGEAMTELVPNTVDAASEKHLPAVTVDGDTVKVDVGSVMHPSDDNHYIDFIYIETENGGQRKKVGPGKSPSVSFKLVDDKAKAVFSYCNLHGLWMNEL